MPAQWHVTTSKYQMEVEVESDLRVQGYMLKNETKPKKHNICSSKALVYIAMENRQNYHPSQVN